MYGWVSDIPTGSRTLFERIIKDTIGHFINHKILEIGSWAGTSVLGFLKLLPNSTATVIDLWEDYIEHDTGTLGVKDSFIHNIEISGVQNRVVAFKAPSREKLISLLQEHTFYHLIYVDGSHLALDVYLDLVLCWKLLIQNGLLIIDDYNFKEVKNYDPFQRPKYGVDHFLKQYDSELRIIHRDYRLFIQKVVL